MNLTVTAEMELDDAAKAWLPWYIREMFNQSAEFCRQVNQEGFAGIRPDALPMNPWEALYINLVVHLHPHGFIEARSGMAVHGCYERNIDLPYSDNYFYEPQGFNNPSLATHTDRIQMYWNPDPIERDMILRSEFLHMIWRHMLMPNWQHIGHGGSPFTNDDGTANAGQMDPVIIWLKKKLHSFYHPRYTAYYPIEWKFPMGG